MKTSTSLRACRIGKYIASNKCTVRAAAKHFKISKSTVYLDVTERLYSVSPDLHSKVSAVLQHNKAQRHLRGGQATKDKYKKLRKD